MSDNVLGINGVGWFTILLILISCTYYSIKNYHWRMTWEAYYKSTKENKKQPDDRTSSDEEQKE